MRAIAASFTQNELGSLLLQECGKRLEDLVALPMEWSPLVTAVVQKAQMQAFTDELVLAVAAWRPHDLALSDVMRELTLMPGQGQTLAVSASARGAASSEREALEGLVRGAQAFADIDQFLADLAATSSRVCRVEDLGLPGAAPTAWGTGFLVGDDLVLTNKHVHDLLPKDGKRIGCRFDYRSLAGSAAVREGTVVKAASNGWWVASRDYAESDVTAGGAPPTPEQLDYALLRLAEPVGRFPNGQSDELRAGKARGHFALDANAGAPAPGSDTFVLQHPEGGPMKLAVGRVLDGAPAHRVRHDAPTQGGSSGSPCFNHKLELVALHHATDPGNPATPAFNQAVPIALIAKDLVAQGKP
ncbi:MAG TPA: serine protease [Ramlibacter sp.]|nr:serine protease [Ramlibacter sp.]